MWKECVQLSETNFCNTPRQNMDYLSLILQKCNLICITPINCMFGYKYKGENEGRKELEVLAAAWRKLGLLSEFTVLLSVVQEHSKAFPWIKVSYNQSEFQSILEAVFSNPAPLTWSATIKHWTLVCQGQCPSSPGYKKIIFIYSCDFWRVTNYWAWEIQTQLSLTLSERITVTSSKNLWGS